MINKITLKDTKNSIVKTFGTIFSEFWWEEGNGACDCNRGTLFGLNVQCSDKNRFKFIKFEKSKKEIM